MPPIVDLAALLGAGRATPPPRRNAGDDCEGGSSGTLNDYNDTDSEIPKIEGVRMTLSDLVRVHGALNSPEPRDNAILVLIEVLMDQVAKLGELHDAEWAAMNAGPLATAAE